MCNQRYYIACETWLRSHSFGRSNLGEHGSSSAPTANEGVLIFQKNVWTRVRFGSWTWKFIRLPVQECATYITYGSNFPANTPAFTPYSTLPPHSYSRIQYKCLAVLSLTSLPTHQRLRPSKLAHKAWWLTGLNPQRSSGLTRTFVARRMFRRTSLKLL